MHAEQMELIEKFDPQWLYSKGYWKKFRQWVATTHPELRLGDDLDRSRTLLAFMHDNSTWASDVTTLWHQWIKSTGGWVRRPSTPF